MWICHAPSSCSKQFGVQEQLAQGVTPHIGPSQSCLLLFLFLSNCFFNSSFHCFSPLRGGTAICSLTSAFALFLLCPPLFTKIKLTVFFHTSLHFLSAHHISLLRMGRYWKRCVCVCLLEQLSFFFHLARIHTFILFTINMNKYQEYSTKSLCLKRSGK